jgi:hypothetical protein
VQLDRLAAPRRRQELTQETIRLQAGWLRWNFVAPGPDEEEISPNELAWAPHLLSTMDYTYRERHGEAIYRFKGPALARVGDGMLPSDFFHRNVVLSFQEDAIGIRLRDVIGTGT